MVKHCIITGDEITPENDSKAHVIPSALGGRLKPLGILCKKGNGLLGDKIDLPLIEAFQSLMNRLNGSRDRGENRPTPMTDDSGKTYIFKFGEPLTLSRPEYKEAAVGGTTEISIEARSIKEARTLLGRAKAKYPAFDIDEALKHAVSEHKWPQGRLHEKLQIGPGVVFPAAFVAASIFSAHHELGVHPQLKEYVTAFEPDDPALPPDTFYFIPPKAWIKSSADVTHVLALAGDAASGKLLAYIEVFNLAKIGVLLPYAGTSDIRRTYSVDILSGKEAPVQIDEAVLMSSPWRPTHEPGDAGVQADTNQQFGRLVTTAIKRENAMGIAQIVERAFGPADGRRLTATDYANVVAEMVSFTTELWSDPSYPQQERLAQVPGFKQLCAKLETMIPAMSRAEFRRLIGPHISKFEAASIKK